MHALIQNLSIETLMLMRRFFKSANCWRNIGASILHSFKGHFHDFLHHFHTSTCMTNCMWLISSSWICLGSGVIHGVTDSGHAHAPAWRHYNSVFDLKLKHEIQPFLFLLKQKKLLLAKLVFSWMNCTLKCINKVVQRTIKDGVVI